MLENRNYTAECTKPGPLCTDCETLVHCVQESNGEFDVIELEKCGEGTTCLTNVCTNAPNPNCLTTEFKFTCTGNGVFPDPYDCKKYHYCAVDHIAAGTAGLTTLECEEHFAYDPVTTYCKNKLADNCLNFPVPICAKVGQTGALVNKSIYYICVRKDGKLYPNLYICPNGKVYENSVCK